MYAIFLNFTINSQPKFTKIVPYIYIYSLYDCTCLYMLCHMFVMYGIEKKLTQLIIVDHGLSFYTVWRTALVFGECMGEGT